MLLALTPAPMSTAMSTAIDAINLLERQIAGASPEDVDAWLWQQAALVVEQLRTMTQREVALQWINPRLGTPYSHKHVWSVAHVFGEYGRQTPRPSFRTMYVRVKWPERGAPDRTPARPIIVQPVVPPKKARVSIEARRVRCRELAGQGYSIPQIAAAIDVHPETVNQYAKAGAYEITARRMGKTRRHDANRIVAQMAMDAENLTADVNLIIFSDLHRHHLAEWITSFTHSAMQLQAFIRKLKEMDL